MYRAAFWVSTGAALCLAAILSTCCPGIFFIANTDWYTLRTKGVAATILRNTSAPAKGWDIRYHLSGNGPWVRKITNTSSGATDLPLGCMLDQVHLISRHAERYPTVTAGTRMIALHQRLLALNTTFHGSLSFLDTWPFFLPNASARLENLIPTGPYAGTLQAFHTGVKLHTRYEQLHDLALSRNQTNFWASGSHRVEETARYFATGFYGLDWEDIAKMHVIPETLDRGADTLTPGRSCPNYLNNANNHGHDHGYRKLDEYKATYLPAIALRLNAENPGIDLTNTDVFTMQEICGFEMLAKGSSPFCAVFSHDECLQFEYARDVLHFYRAGEGNKYGASMGWLMLNATTELLDKGSGTGPLFFSFVHDGDLVPFFAALDLFPEPGGLPTTHILENRSWKTSTIVPMGGRVILERLICDATDDENVYVRVNVNDGIVPVPGCDSGPGQSCSLEEWKARVSKRGEELPDFGKLCGLGGEAPESIRFLHQ